MKEQVDCRWCGGRKRKRLMPEVGNWVSSEFSPRTLAVQLGWVAATLYLQDTTTCTELSLGTYSPVEDLPKLPKGITTNKPSPLAKYLTMEWHPTQFFSPSPPPFALLILNQPINERAFSVLHQHGLLPSFLPSIYPIH